MRLVIAILACVLLAAPADARLFGRGGNNGGNCANGKCKLNGNKAKANAAVNADSAQKKTSDDATANQLADVLTRFDDLAVQQYVPPIPSGTQTPPLSTPPVVDTSKIDELTKTIAELKQQIDDLKNKQPATPPWTPPAKETPAIGDQPAPPKPAKVVYDIERKN